MTALLEFREAKKEFATKRGPIVACADVSFHVGPGEVVGLVGESGSGKSTVANLALGLLPASGGEVRFMGERLDSASRRRRKELRSQLQAVFQEPFLALDRRWTVAWSIAEPLRIHGRGTPAERDARVAELLAAVGLSSAIGSRRPSDLSGGQLQRVNIARAIALEPSLLICDEAVSALDVSIQAQILNLFLEIQRTLGIGMLFISHDLAVVRHLSDRIVVMYAGRVVEEGPTEELCAEPHHPYTRALLAASLEPEVGASHVVPVTMTLRDRVPDRGCRFVPRCPLAEAACAEAEPPLRATVPGRLSACRRAELLVGGVAE